MIKFKKIGIFAVILSIFLTAFSITSNAQIVDEKSDKGYKEHPYYEPLYDDLYDDYSSELEGFPSTYSVDATKDEYESNDSFASATLLSPSFSGTSVPYDYNKTINATLHRNEWLWGLWKREVDEDYYKIQIYGKAKLKINLDNIPQDCDYDLELYEFDNVKYCEEDDISLISYSRYTGTYREKIEKDILPNVYFIRVYSYKGFDAQNKYSLNIDIDYQYNNESISDLKYTNGARAAMWISDYDPFGIGPFTTTSKEEIGYFTSSSSYSAYKISHPFTSILKGRDEVLHASIFIWDKDLRLALNEIVKQLIVVTEKELASNERIRIEIETTENVINGVALVGSVVLSVYSVTAAAAKYAVEVALGSIGLSVTPGTLNGILEAFIPYDKIEQQKNYISYLRVLSAALECNKNTDSNEVVRIDSKYKMVTESAIGIVHMDYMLDFTPMYQESYLYGKDVISAYQEGAYFNGTVYPIQSLEDVKRARQKNQIELEEVNTGGNTPIQLNYPKIDSIDTGQYYWYNFTAPENGVYCFFTQGDTDTVGELFHNIVPGRQTKGCILSHDDIDLVNGNKNFRIEYSLYKGQTIYIRVHGFNWTRTGLYLFQVEKIRELELTTEVISKEKLNYREEYVDSPETTGVTLDSGFDFTTKRLRCGYISNSYLTLSAKCKDAGVAYLEFDFNQRIQSFNFDMAIWSTDERLNKDSYIIFEIKDSHGNWSTYYTFDITSLSKNKDILNSFNFDFTEGVYGTRITVVTNLVTSTKNLGRVVLDNITLTH